MNIKKNPLRGVFFVVADFNEYLKKKSLQTNNKFCLIVLQTIDLI